VCVHLVIKFSVYFADLVRRRPHFDLSIIERNVTILFFIKNHMIKITIVVIAIIVRDC